MEPAAYGQRRYLMYLPYDLDIVLEAFPQGTFLISRVVLSAGLGAYLRFDVEPVPVALTELAKPAGSIAPDGVIAPPKSTGRPGFGFD